MTFSFFYIFKHPIVYIFGNMQISFHITSCQPSAVSRRREKLTKHQNEKVVRERHSNFPLHQRSPLTTALPLKRTAICSFAWLSIFRCGFFHMHTPVGPAGFRCLRCFRCLRWRCLCGCGNGSDVRACVTAASTRAIWRQLACASISELRFAHFPLTHFFCGCMRVYVRV